MRVLFATMHKHLPEIRGGMEVNTHQLAQELIARGNAVGVLCGLAGVGLTGFSARLRMKLLRTAAPRDQSLGYPVWRAWDAVSAVPGVARIFHPNVVVIQGGAHFEGLVRACLTLGVPVVCYAHSQDRMILPDEIRESPNLHFVVNSRFTATLHPDKTIGGIFRPLVRRAEYAVESERSSAVFINPARYKGVEIVERLAAARPDVPFLFVVNRHAMTAKAAGLDCSDHPNVRFIGPFSDMRPVYRQAKVVLAPSQCMETWGRVATEAHLSGIPVLASDSGGLPEAVGPGGLCLPVDAPASEWLAAFSTIWDDETRYQEMSEAALHYAQRPDIDAVQIVDSFVAYLAGLQTGRTQPLGMAWQKTAN